MTNYTLMESKWVNNSGWEYRTDLQSGFKFESKPTSNEMRAAIREYLIDNGYEFTEEMEASGIDFAYSFSDAETGREIEAETYWLSELNN